MAAPNKILSMQSIRADCDIDFFILLQLLFNFKVEINSRMSSPLMIQIRWDWSVETILIDLDFPLTNGKQFETTEIWSWEGNEVVTYSTEVISYKVDGSNHLLCLNYSPEKNPDLDREDNCWGISTIKFNPRKKMCKATWVNIPTNKQYDGVARGSLAVLTKVELLDYEASLRIKRQQHSFKKAILGYSANCELSNESEPCALDAAHIVGVSELGIHSPCNGLLLRTDLHRLFDQRLLRISSKNGQASLAKSVSRSSGYHALVKSMKLKPETLERVRASLIERESDGL